MHYWFLDREDFDRKVVAGEFLEWVDYVGNRYGTLNSEIDRLRAEGRAPLLELETDGALRVGARVPSAVTIFVTAPVEELERRLRERATESTGVIDERLATARRQLELRIGSISSFTTTSSSRRPTTSRRSSRGRSIVPLPWPRP